MKTINLKDLIQELEQATDTLKSAAESLREGYYCDDITRLQLQAIFNANNGLQDLVKAYNGQKPAFTNRGHLCKCKYLGGCNNEH